jgi:WD40 repeat protein
MKTIETPEYLMSESILCIMNGHQTNHHLYQRAGGIIKGHQETATQYLNRIAINVERLSEKIWYAPSAISVQDVSKPNQQYVDDLREVRACLEPVQRAVGEKILSSAMIATPLKMQQALAKNPWEVLMDIRPLNLATKPPYADMTPMLFSHKGVLYLGWQMRGALPQLFNCQYDELWRPNPLLETRTSSIFETQTDQLWQSNSSELRTSSILCGNQVMSNQSRLPTQIFGVLQGHKDWVNSVAFSPNGQLIASGSEDRTIKLWEMSKGQEFRTFKKGWLRKGHEAPVRTVSFSPDGNLIASGSDDNTIKLWEVKTGKLIRTLPDNGLGVKTVAFSPNGHLLASVNETVKLWEVQTGICRPIKGVKAIAFSPNGQILATGGPNETIKLWEVSTGKELISLKRHLSHVAAIAFSPDGRTLVSGSEDKTLKLWDLNNGEARRTWKSHDQSVCSIAFHPNGEFLASASADKTIKLWNTEMEHELCTLQGHDCMVNSIAFSPDGRTLATASNDKTIKLWQ